MEEVMGGKSFDRVAQLYRKVRPTYPKRVYELIQEAGGGRRFDVAVDIGCGAGQSLAGLREIAQTCIGVEPSDKLRAEAQSAYPGLEVRNGTGEDTGLPARSADLVTVATAFYWMKKDVAINEANRLLRGPGVFATYKYDFPRVSGPAGAVVDRHLAQHWDAFRSKRLTDYDDTAELMRASGHFASVTTPVVPYTLQYDAAGYVEFMSSTSYVSTFLQSLKEPQEYVERFTRELREAEPGKLDVCFDIFMNIARKRP